MGRLPSLNHCACILGALSALALVVTVETALPERSIALIKRALIMSFAISLKDHLKFVCYITT